MCEFFAREESSMLSTSSRVKDSSQKQRREPSLTLLELTSLTMEDCEKLSKHLEVSLRKATADHAILSAFY